jgi:hypothetical protein
MEAALRDRVGAMRRSVMNGGVESVRARRKAANALLPGVTMVWGGESQEGSSILVKLLSVVVGLPFLGAFLVPSADSPPFPPPLYKS